MYAVTKQLPTAPAADLEIRPLKRLSKHVGSLKVPEILNLPFAASIVSRQIGPIPAGIAPCKPALNDPLTCAAGVCKRVGRQPSPVNRKVLRQFRKFCRAEAMSLPRLDPNTDLTEEEWIENGNNYPEWRKQQLRDVLLKHPIFTKRHYRVKGFLKDEFYPTYKYARLIMARSDRAKIFFGPLAKAVEKIVFADPSTSGYIKKVPVTERPDFIEDLLNHIPGLPRGTDYTSLEASLVDEVMEACEFELMTWMVSACPDAKRIWNKMKKVLKGMNNIETKWFVFSLLARRMSGEMSTSLFNGWVNRCVTRFRWPGDRSVAQFRTPGVVGVYEGDDAAFKPLPQRNGQPQKPQLKPEDINFIMKEEISQSINEMSFCGMIYDETRTPLVDIRWALLKFGWSAWDQVNMTEPRARIIMRAKALSYLVQYPGCPVVSVLANRVEVLTRDVQRKLVTWVETDRSIGHWKREEYRRVIDANPVHKNITPSARVMVEEQFGVTIDEQLRLEAVFATIGLYDTYEVAFTVPHAWIHCWDHCVSPYEPHEYRHPLNEDGPCVSI